MTFSNPLACLHRFSHFFLLLLGSLFCLNDIVLYFYFLPNSSDTVWEEESAKASAKIRQKQCKIKSEMKILKLGYKKTSKVELE